MKKIIWYCLLILTVSCSTSKDAFKDLKWIIGNWQMQDAEGITTEAWQMGKQQLIGSSSMGKTTATLKPFEDVTITYNGKQYVYTVTSANQNDTKPVAFTITKHTATSFIAVNMQHDYPKRIAYELLTKDSIHAYIDDGVEDSKKRFHFYYNKLK
jgi:hypothetical protein